MSRRYYSNCLFHRFLNVLLVMTLKVDEQRRQYGAKMSDESGCDIFSHFDAIVTEKMNGVQIQEKLFISIATYKHQLSRWYKVWMIFGHIEQCNFGHPNAAKFSSKFDRNGDISFCAILNCGGRLTSNSALFAHINSNSLKRHVYALIYLNLIRGFACTGSESVYLNWQFDCYCLCLNKEERVNS